MSRLAADNLINTFPTIQSKSPHREAAKFFNITQSSYIKTPSKWSPMKYNSRSHKSQITANRQNLHKLSNIV